MPETIGQQLDAQLTAIPTALEATLTASTAFLVSEIEALKTAVNALEHTQPTPTPDPVPEPTPTPVPEPTQPPVPREESHFTLVNATGMSQNATGRADTQWMQPDFNWPADNDMTPFIGGDAYMRLNVTDKPSGLLTAAQLCMWNQDDNSTFTLYEETCSPWKSAIFQHAGVYYIQWRPPTSWYNAPQGPKTTVGVFPWTEKPNVLRLFMKPVTIKGTHTPASPDDTDIGGNLLLANRNGGGANWDVTDTELNKHLPIKADFEVILVAAGQPFQPPSNWAGNPWQSPDPTPVPAPIPTPAPVPTPDPTPTSGVERRFLVHGAGWTTYGTQADKIVAGASSSMGKFQFAVMGQNSGLFKDLQGWTTLDTFNAAKKVWGTPVPLAFKLQLPRGIPVACWKSSHSGHNLIKAWLVTFGKQVAERQRAGTLTKQMPVTILHENLGRYSSVAGWSVLAGNTVQDYAAFFKWAAALMKGQGADILALYAPNNLRTDEMIAGARQSALAIGADLDGYGMSHYPYAQNMMASLAGYASVGITPTAYQKLVMLDNQCTIIRGFTDKPFWITEIGFNPKRQHTDSSGKLHITNAADPLKLIPDVFTTMNKWDVAGFWYFNVGGKRSPVEELDIFVDGVTDTQHTSATRRVLVSEGMRWAKAGA